MIYKVNIENENLIDSQTICINAPKLSEEYDNQDEPIIFELPIKN